MKTIISRQRGGIFFRLIFLCAFLGLLFVLYLLRAPLLHAAGNYWVVDDGPRPSDVIIILSDDNYHSDRASKAAQLAQAGWAPRIVASGRLLRPYAGIAELMERDLVERGIPREAVIRFSHNATDTRQEAEALLRLVRERGWRNVIVVTSNYHTRRTRFTYSRVFPASIAVRVEPAPDSEFDPANWWRTHSGKKRFFYELGAYILARWELRNGDPSVN